MAGLNVNEIIERHTRDTAAPVKPEKKKRRARRRRRRKAHRPRVRLNLLIDEKTVTHAKDLSKRDNRSLGNYIETLIMRDLAKINRVLANAAKSDNK